MGAAVQLALSDPSQFQTLPYGGGHYVPVLQTKPGELRALREAPPEVWSHTTPLVMLLGPKMPGLEPFTHSRVDGWVKRVAAAVGTHTTYMDLLRLKAGHLADTREGRVPVLTAIYAAARRRGIQFVPVFHLDDTTGTTRQIADTIERDGRGASLRIPLLGTTTLNGQDLRSLATAAVTAVGLEIADVDLMLDLKHIGDDVELHAEDLCPMIEALMDTAPWRNVILIGTTIPRSLGGGVVPAGTIGQLSRREWDLWLELNTRLTRRPAYGDYAVQHPEPPLDVQGGKIPLGLRAAIRYTYGNKTIIPRAKAPRHEEGREQYRKLCRELVALPEFAGRQYSWGDQQIADCADGQCEPGWEDHWRGAATSHHLRVVTDQLQQLN